MDDFGERIPVSQSISATFPKVSLIRTTEARGVAGARIAGAEVVRPSDCLRQASLINSSKNI